MNCLASFSSIVVDYHRKKFVGIFNELQPTFVVKIGSVIPYRRGVEVGAHTVVVLFTMKKLGKFCDGKCVFFKLGL